MYILYPQLQIKKKTQVITCGKEKKTLDLITEKLQSHKRATFFKICEYNISINQ